MDITVADQDSDSIYTTNQPEIVEHAKHCYQNYPTIVNEVKPEKNKYDLSIKNYAKIDNELTAAQMAIGMSSNLAQLCLTYTYNSDDQKYSDYVCILSVVAQIAIDNAKRKYDVDLETEIPYIQNNMNIDKMGLPEFWEITKKDKRKARSDKERNERNKRQKQKIREKVNRQLVCPMNYLGNIKFKKYRSTESTIPISDFFIKHEQDLSRRKSKKIEDLIEKYSIDLRNFYCNHYDGWDEDTEKYVMVEQFDELIDEIKSIYVSKNYLGLMSWLINRAFMISYAIKGSSTIDSETNKNHSLFLKVLYSLNKDAFLACFKSKNCTHD